MALLILAMVNIKSVSCLTIFEKKIVAVDRIGASGHDRDLKSVNLSRSPFHDPDTSYVQQTSSAPNTGFLKPESWTEFRTTESPDTSTLKEDTDPEETTSTDFSSSSELEWSTVIFTTPEFTADKPLETARKDPLFF